MPSRFMLDTDICIYFQGGARPNVVGRFMELAPGEAVISVITYGELRLGAEKSSRRDLAFAALDRLLEAISVEPLSYEAAGEYAAIRADLEHRGQPIGANDLWIAAHARASDLTLVTNNEREFRRVPGLRVENWASA